MSRWKKVKSAFPAQAEEKAMGYHRSSQQKTMQRKMVLICTLVSVLPEIQAQNSCGSFTLAQPFLFPVHSSDWMPAPFLQQILKEFLLFQEVEEGSSLIFLKQEESLAFLKEALCRGMEGSCLFVGDVSSSGATEHIPGTAPWWMALSVMAPRICCVCAVGEQAQISI